jgi:hypothetical protein
LQDKGKAAFRVLGWTGILFLPLALPLAGIFPNLSRPEYLLASGVGVCGAILMVILAMAKRPRAALLVIVLLITSLVEIADIKVLPQLDTQISSRALAQELLRDNPTGENVGVYDIPRAWHYGLNFYLNRDLPEWTPDSGDLRWVAGSISTDFQFQERYQIVLDEIAEANKFQVCLYRRN